jgi:hypothetical protein
LASLTDNSPLSPAFQSPCLLLNGGYFLNSFRNPHFGIAGVRQGKHHHG